MPRTVNQTRIQHIDKKHAETVMDRCAPLVKEYLRRKSFDLPHFKPQMHTRLNEWDLAFWCYTQGALDVMQVQEMGYLDKIVKEDN